MNPVLWEIPSRLVQTLVQNRDVILDRSVEHIWIAAVAVAGAVLIGVPVAVLLTRVKVGAEMVIGLAGVVQAIPSIALLALMVPLVGIGDRPAIIALILYGLMPIMRNTYTGILQVDRGVVEAARGMGMTSWQVLLHVELVLAARMIFNGVRTAAVFIVAWGTLAAFIGGGGLGNLMVPGLQLMDPYRILAGGIPATILALLTDKLLGWGERFAIPKGLRL